MKLIIWTIRVVFLALFFTIGYYIVNIETERYESRSIVGLKDLSQKQEVNLGSLLSGSGSETVKNSRILELYIRSAEMYDRLDKKYHFTAYYTGKILDFYQRLYDDAILPAWRANKDNLLKSYNRDLFVVFDNPSETLEIKFAFYDANTSQQILKDIIRISDETINAYSRESARVSLEFISKVVKENRQKFIHTIKKLIAYQNEHHTFDPHLDVERKYTVLAELEADLIKKEIEYSSKLKTNWNPSGLEMRTLKANIVDIKNNIQRMKKEISGNDKTELNVDVFGYEVLKNEMEFAKEVYKETLINQEKAKIEANQNANHLVVITKPTLPDSYTYPDKVWDLFTLFLTLLFLYSIIMTSITILRDHLD